MKEELLLSSALTLALATVSFSTVDTWTYKADMPAARVFIGGCVLDGKIYVIGGAPSVSSVTRAVERYDPVVDTWTRLADMPSGRCYHATCTFDGKIYVFGGASPDMWSMSKKNVYVYDPPTDIWTQKADMPYANANCGIAVIDDKIYLIGGGIGGPNPPFSTVMAYDPVAESWTQKADMPTARYSLSACALDGKIYAIGGAEDWSVFSYNWTEVYDPSTDTWTRKSHMPTERWALGTCVVDGKIFAIGGSTVGTVSTTVNEAYDPVTDTWITKSPMQQKRYGLFEGSVGDKIYAMGGSVPGFLSTVEEYNTGFGVPSPDFNGDYVIDIHDLIILIAHWKQEYPLCDIAPPPFGDDVVDVLDLELLMSYWEQEVPDPALIAHWKLDEIEGDIAYDSVGDNDGYILSDAVWHPDGGQVDGALEFDGIDDYLSTPVVVDPAKGDFSAFVWIKGGAPGQVIVSQQGGTDWLMADGGDGALRTDLKQPPAGIGRDSAPAGPPLIGPAVVVDGDWHRVGFVRDGSNRILYVDDVEVARDTATNLESAVGALHIGTDYAMQSGTFFSGLIDDVRIYNRAVKP